MSARTVSIHFVRAALYGAARRSVEFDWLLRQVGIHPALLAEPRARVTFEQYARLIRILWRTLDDELLGFGSAALRHGSFAMMCQAVIHCSNLERALRRGIRFYELFPHAPRFSLWRDGEVAQMQFELSGFDDPDHFLMESLLVIWHRFSAWMVGSRIPLLGVQFAYQPPPHRTEYELMFGCPLEFQAPVTAIRFAANELDRPLVRDTAELSAFLDNAPYGLLSRPEYGDTLAARIRRLIARHPEGQGLGADAVAAHLSMSPQTLRRRLGREKTSFQTIKDQWRRDIAIALLSEEDLPGAEVARRLGFSEPSAFHRAFRKWTGLPPGAYRRRIG